MSILKGIYLPPGLCTQPDWGTFISPDERMQHCANPNDIANVSILTGSKADFKPVKGKNALFDSVVDKIIKQRDSISFEDQCSGQYYYDIFTQIRASLPDFNRIAEVGVYAGGSSCVIAGCIEDADTELDLIDLNKDYLRFSYERIRRLFPKVAARTRLFFGDLPTYVKNVMLDDQQHQYLVHHDAAHMFNIVVRDLASLYYVRNKIYALMIQDTHLRGGNVNSFLFVDAALYAIFGDGLQYAELGVKFGAPTHPAFQYNMDGTYFNSNLPEGMFVPFALTHFRYPHPSIKLESFFDEGSLQDAAGISW